MSIAVDEVRKEYFMSLAPVYLFTSYYLAKAASTETSIKIWPSLPTMLVYILAGVTMAVVIWLVAVSFCTRLKKYHDKTYKTCASLGILTALVFLVGWVDTIGPLLNANASPIFVYPYVVLGVVLYVTIIFFNIYNAFWGRCRRQKCA
jgi:hypothetical protein